MDCYSPVLDARKGLTERFDNDRCAEIGLLIMFVGSVVSKS